MLQCSLPRITGASDALSAGTLPSLSISPGQGLPLYFPTPHAMPPTPYCSPPGLVVFHQVP